tara:strand:+ start:3545 stop:4009 length:465 start_codon:yes stop_codon:yes gene_type:complete
MLLGVKKNLLRVGLLAGTSISMLLPNCAFGSGLQKFEWNSRLIILFSPSLRNNDLNSQTKDLKTFIDGVVERHIRIITAVGRGPVKVDGLIDTTLNASKLRSEYRVLKKQFSIILVGKDGDEKGRWLRPVKLEKLFDLIDEMPMRINEIYEQGS